MLDELARRCITLILIKSREVPDQDVLDALSNGSSTGEARSREYSALHGEGDSRTFHTASIVLAIRLRYRMQSIFVQFEEHSASFSIVLRNFEGVCNTGRTGSNRDEEDGLCWKVN